jgi:hypothetical protein
LLVGSVVIDVELGREDHSSISGNYDREKQVLSSKVHKKQKDEYLSLKGKL